MDIQKISAYALALLGLAGIIVSSGKLKETIPVIKTLPTSAILIVGVALVGVGIVILKIGGNSSTKQHKEVPIYEGRGKKRRIVGYQREN